MTSLSRFLFLSSFGIAAVVACGTDDEQPAAAGKGGSAGTTGGSSGKGGKGTTAGSSGDGAGRAGTGGVATGGSSGRGGSAGRAANSGGTDAGQGGRAGASGESGAGTDGGAGAGGSGDTVAGGSGGEAGFDSGGAGQGGIDVPDDVSGGAGGAENGEGGAPSIPDSCAEITATGSWTEHLEDGYALYIDSISPNLGTPQADRLLVEFFGSNEVGTFALGTGVDRSFFTCEQCVTVFVSDGTTYGTNFFAAQGSFEIAESSVPMSGTLDATLADVTLLEVTDDFSSFVANGECLHLASASLSLTP